MRLADVAGPHAAAEAEHGGIGALHQLVHILERYRRDDRTKNLFLGDAHVVAHIGEHCRRHEIAFRQRPLCQTLATGKRARSFLLAEAQIAGHALELLLRHQRADLRFRIEPVADAEVLAERRDPICELVIDFLLDEQTRAGAADLTGIGEHRHGGAGHRGLDIGVGKHDVGRLAAKSRARRA